MKLDFAKLLTENEFCELQERAEKFDLFEYVRYDKKNKIELRISAKRCDNGIWQNNYMCAVDGSKKYGDYYGFGCPYQQSEFLELTYKDIVGMFGRLGFEIENTPVQLKFTI
ncbi:MAG: hypothetical protein LBH47_03855 [Christensenellaceae bacterium]|jgi:hypothetical protein|nr:hypothetical protein [Christensenellaceae bacterium]